MYTNSGTMKASKDHQIASKWYPVATTAPSLLSLSSSPPYSSTSDPHQSTSTSGPVAPLRQNIPYIQDSIVPLPLSFIRDSPIDSSASYATTNSSQRLAPHSLRSFPCTMSIETGNGYPSVTPFLTTQESSLRYSFVRGHATNEVTMPNIPSNSTAPHVPSHPSLVRHSQSYPPLHDPSISVHNLQQGHHPSLPYTANVGSVLLSDDCTTTSPQELTDRFDTNSGSSASTIEHPRWNNASNVAATTARDPVDERAVIIPVSPDLGSHPLPVLSGTNGIPTAHRDVWRSGFHEQLYHNPTSLTAAPIPVPQWGQTASSSWAPSASFPVPMPVSTFDPIRAQLPNTDSAYMPRRRTTYPPQQPYAFIEENSGQMDYRPSDPPGRTHGQRPTVGPSWSGHTGREGVGGEVYASTSTTTRSNRPPVSFRRRSSISAGVGTSLVVKRKPLPKIYGCETCGKKFDRPSTLKVVCKARFFLSPCARFHSH
ncbi:hypothetical protein CPB86DRAFT_111030 [Serendipita vermifera]|nr:hypothetical protein CPB86DRAFT_111030 [Serendipita vermifera]